MLPKEVLIKLKVREGDTLFLTEGPDGYRITPYDPDLEQQLETGREFMKEYRDAFRALTK